MGVETAFQQAVFDALNGAKASLGIAQVYDIKPQQQDGGNGAIYPCAVIGEIFAVEADTQTTIGFEVTFRLHIYDRTGSMKACKDIQGRVFDLLHRQALSIAGYSNFLLLRQDTQCDAGINETVHGTCEYFARVERTS